MARGAPIVVLLRECVESLRIFLSLDPAEVGIVESGRLRLEVADPPTAARALPISTELKPVILNTPVSGPAWVRTWMPDLLAGRPEGEFLRLAPVSHAGELLGSLVVGRPGGPSASAM